MPTAAAGAIERVSVDPALAYLAFATVFLAGVAVAAGVSRRDWRALRAPTTLLKLLAAIGLGLLLAHTGAVVAAALDPDTGPWSRLGGMYRAPLYVAALAYGPSAGVVAGMGYLAASALGLTPVAGSPVLVIELAVLGWLAIYPSPWRHRWAGPVDAAMAYVLAWATGGLLLLEARGQGVSAVTIAAQHEGMLVGALASAVVLFALGPAAYRRAFAESRIQIERTDPVDAPS